MKQLSITVKNNIIGYLKKDINKIDYVGIIKTANQGKEKYTYADILNFLIEYQYNNFTKKSDISIKLIEKLAMFTHDILVREQPNDLDNVVVSKILKLKDEYLKFCESKNIESNQDLIKCYEEIMDCFKVKDQTSTANAILQINTKLEKLEEDNKNLIDEKAALEKKAAKAASEKDKLAAKKDEKIALKESEIKELKKEIKTLKNELDKFKKSDDLTSDELENKKKIIAQLESKIKEYESLNASLTNENKQMISRNMELNNTINHMNNSSAFKLEQEMIHNVEFDSRIIDLLITKKYSIDELFVFLNASGVSCSYADVFASIKRIQQEINIEPTGEITIPKLYEVQRPEVVSDKQVSIKPVNGGYKDFLFISDLHIGSDSTEDYYMYQKLYGIYDYCTEKGIDTIINLGDVMDSDEQNIAKSAKGFEEHKKQLEDTVIKLNDQSIINSGVNQLILGGNHDMYFARYGIDPVKYLADNNTSFIPIGYEDARIRFAGTDDYIGLHHSGVPREEVFNNDNKKITVETLNYLKKYYNRIGFNQDKIYFDFFGHTHKGKVDPQNAYGIIPSFKHDRFTDGATKVRVFFDINGNIDYLLIYPLSIGKRIEQINEIPYARKRAL